MSLKTAIILAVGYQQLQIGVPIRWRRPSGLISTW